MSDWPATITPNDLIRWLEENHHTPEDLGEGDLSDRLYAFARYDLKRIPLDTLRLDEWSLDDEMAASYRDMAEKTPPPPIVFDPVNASIIDGTHRANAAAMAGHVDVLAYVGDPETYEEPIYEGDDED